MAYDDPDGHRRLLAITLGPEESEAVGSSSSSSWSEVSAASEDRDGPGSCGAPLPAWVRRQCCTVHLQRNVLAGERVARGCRRLPGGHDGLGRVSPTEPRPSCSIRRPWLASGRREGRAGVPRS